MCLVWNINFKSKQFASCSSTMDKTDPDTKVDPSIAKAALRLAKFALDKAKPITIAVGPDLEVASNKKNFPVATSVSEINKLINASEEFDIEAVTNVAFQTGQIDTPNNLLAFKYLMEAIGRNSTIEELWLPVKITPEQWEFIIKALQVNNSITMIHFGANSNRLTHIAQVLKTHEVLKDCRLVLPFTLPDEDIEEFAGALTTSKALRAFELHGPLTRSAVPSGKILSIFKALKEHREIVKCKFDSLTFSTDTSNTLASMIRYNEGLKYLTFKYCDIDALTDPLHDILKLNTSITELDLALSNFTLPHMAKILQIFKENSTITSLILDGINLNNKAVTVELTSALKANTLHKLSLADCHLNTDDIAKGLALNKSLTWLALTKNTVRAEKLKPFLHNSRVRHLILNDCTIEPRDCAIIFTSLKENKSLTNLQMKNINLQEPALNALASLFDLNDTLRVLHIKRDTPTSLPMRPLFMALVRNTGLRVLHIDKIREQYHPEWDFLRADILKSNTSLCQLTINGEVDKVVDDQLRPNRDRFTGVIAFLKMMVLRPDTFFEVFPMEIWTKIFSYIEGVDIRALFSD